MSQEGKSIAIDPDKMNAFLEKVIADFGASLSSMFGYIGQRLGLYEALTDSDDLTTASSPIQRAPMSDVFANG